MRGLSKLAERDWVNGAAVFYDIRDPAFGSSGITRAALRALTAQPWGTAALTWGTIVLECAIALAVVSASRFKQYSLVAVIVLHFGIAVALGLWSFAMIMIGTVTIAAYTFPEPLPHRSPPMEPGREGSRHQPDTEPSEAA